MKLASTINSMTMAADFSGDPPHRKAKQADPKINAKVRMNSATRRNWFGAVHQSRLCGALTQNGFVAHFGFVRASIRV